MEVFWRLLFGHLLADFTLQSNAIAAWKRRNIWGMLFHVTIHPVLYVALTWPYINDVWVRFGWVELNGWSCVLLTYVLHLFEDEWRIWSVLKRGAPDNAVLYFWDQIIHAVVLLAIFPPREKVMESLWPVLGCLFVVVTHFGTVSIYFIEKDFFGKDYPRTSEKYTAMFGRLLVSLALILPGRGWLFVVPIWIGHEVWHRCVRRFESTWLGHLLGQGVAVGCGLLARWLIYYS